MSNDSESKASNCLLFGGMQWRRSASLLKLALMAGAAGDDSEFTAPFQVVYVQLNI